MASDQFPTKTLEQIIQDAEGKYASLMELGLREDLHAAFIEACHWVCYGAVNLVIENTSSTSGMGGMWKIGISPLCTVYIDRVGGTLPSARGRTLEAAAAEFILNIRKKKFEFNREGGSDA